MPTLAEIVATPQTLEEAANDFVAFRSSRTGSVEDMNAGIESDEQLIAILNQCGTSPSLDYRKFCGIGADDFCPPHLTSPRQTGKVDLS